MQNAAPLLRMGVLAKYLDLLPHNARERVLHAEKWCARDFADEDGARNLLGHAEDWLWIPGTVAQCRAPHVFRLREVAGDTLWTDEPLIGQRFERLLIRYGRQRALAIIRARIAGNRVPIRRLRRGPLTLVT